MLNINTAEVHPYDLFEAECRFLFTWYLDGMSKVFFKDRYGDDIYSIMQLTSSTLMLGWLEDGKVVEITTFRKAD